jgi:hypothetical protein
MGMQLAPKVHELTMVATGGRLDGILQPGVELSRQGRSGLRGGAVGSSGHPGRLAFGPPGLAVRTRIVARKVAQTIAGWACGDTVPMFWCAGEPELRAPGQTARRSSGRSEIPSAPLGGDPTARAAATRDARRRRAQVTASRTSLDTSSLRAIRRETDHCHMGVDRGLWRLHDPPVPAPSPH